MRKIIACIIIAVFMTTALCACGRYGDARDDGVYPSIETPAATTMINPDMDEEDGIVNDRDGFIEDDDTVGTNNGSAGSRNSGVSGTSNDRSETGSSGAVGSGAAGSSTGSTTSPKVTEQP